MITVIKRFSVNLLYIMAGTLIAAVGLNSLLVPNKISIGGVSTVATIAFYIFKIPVSVTNLVSNILLLIFASRYLNKSALINTVIAIFSLSFFIELTKSIPVIANDLLISAVLGGALMGFGVGIVVRHNASTGGSDLAAMTLNRIFPHISISGHILIIDAVVMFFAILFFSDVHIIFYSVFSIFVFTKVIDIVLTTGTSAKSIYVFSDRADEMAINIMALIKRGVSGIQSKGMYSSNERTMLLCVVSAKELPRLTVLIKKTDPSAFIIISDVKKVLGQGFETLP